MRKNILRVFMFTLILVALFQLKVFATTMEVTTDIDNYDLNEDVTVTVNFNSNLIGDGFSGIKSTDFILQYNSTKLLFTGASISKDFCSVSKDTTEENCNIINVSWNPEDGIHLYDMTFTFKAIEKGKTDIKIKSVESCVAYIRCSTSTGRN